MADNTYRGSGEQRPWAADEVAGVLYQRTKLVWGADNTCTDTSAANPLPVTQPALIASTALIGDVALGVRATATNALLALHRVATADANAVNVKNGAGRLYGFSANNVSNGPRYIKFHNIATAPTPGSGVVRSFCVPAGQYRDVFLDQGHFFATGIGMTITGAMADADTTACSAGDVLIEVWYA